MAAPSISQAIAPKVLTIASFRSAEEMNWSPEAITPVSVRMPSTVAQALNWPQRSESAGSCTLLTPEIRPSGSPRALVSMSCCTTAEEIATEPMLSLSESAPATPVLTMHSG